MSRRPTIFRLFLRVSMVAIAVLGAPLAVRAAEPAGAADGVLVLRNGNVLSGAVRRFGDDYRIAVGGGELQVPAEQVEMFAATLDDAYEARRQNRAGASANSHLELARWCLRLELFNQAARELLDARILDPRHPGIAPLEIQLRQMLELEAMSRDHATKHETPPSAATANDEPVLPPPPISLAAQAQFVRSIQPMLVNGCAMGGCHQPGSVRQLQIDRWALEGNGNPVIVRRNLSSVLQALNVDDPPSSPLMTWARSTHGQQSGAASRPLAAYQAALLLEWLNLAAGVEPPANLPNANDVSPDESGQPTVVESEVIREPAQLEAASSFTPRDAFDPEIFNRRHEPADMPVGDLGAASQTLVEPEVPTIVTE